MLVRPLFIWILHGFYNAGITDLIFVRYDMAVNFIIIFIFLSGGTFVKRKGFFRVAEPYADGGVIIGGTSLWMMGQQG